MPCGLAQEEIQAKLLVLHGYDDPSVKPEAVLGFAKEMTDAGVDWQLHAYGGTVHAFTNPEANDRASGLQYSERADARSWQSMRAFLAEVLA